MYFESRSPLYPINYVSDVKQPMQNDQCKATNAKEPMPSHQCQATMQYLITCRCLSSLPEFRHLPLLSSHSSACRLCWACCFAASHAISALFVVGGTRDSCMTYLHQQLMCSSIGPACTTTIRLYSRWQHTPALKKQARTAADLSIGVCPQHRRAAYAYMRSSMCRCQKW